MAETYIEAAMNGKDGSQEAHFFLADHYVTYNWGGDRVADGVRPVSDWGVPPAFTPRPAADTTTEPPGLDAAIKGRESFRDFGYLFKGTSYVRCRMEPRGLDGSGLLSAWNLPGPVFSGGIDAGFTGRLSRDGKAYLFGRNQYNRYDWRNDTPDTVDPNGLPYPRPIGNMVGMPPDFASGVSAAVDGDGSFEHFGYLFREDRYLRFQWVAAGGGEPHVDGPSAGIHKVWPGLVELLLAGKAKAKALVWIAAAQASLAGAATPAVNAALSTHFRIDPSMAAATRSTLVAQIQTTYAAVVTTLGNSPAVFRYRTDDEARLDGMTPVPAAYTSFGGRMSFTEHFPEKKRMARAAIVLHEAVHVIDVRSHERTPTGGLAIDVPEWYVTDAQAALLGLPTQANRPDLATRYDLMPATDAIHNPSAFAAFAQHVAIGTDTRFGDVNQGPE